MKKRTIVMTVLVALLLASCVVKSLKPFYTKDTLAYDGSLIGTWEDEKLRVWEVVPMMKYLESNSFNKGIDLDEKIIKGKKLTNIEKELDEKKVTAKLAGSIRFFGDKFQGQTSTAEFKVNSQTNGKANPKNPIDSIKINGKVTISKNKDFFRNKDLQEIYKNAYLFINESKEKGYVVVPFQIKGQIFLDFTPFMDETSSAFDDMHYIGIHTLAKLDKNGDGFKLSWLSEDVIQELFKQKKIRIRHEKIGLDKEKFLLTASSDELQKFIAKYMNLELKDKWDGTKLTFNRIK